MYDTYALGAHAPQELNKDEFSALAEELRYIPESKKVTSYMRMKKEKRFSFKCIHESTCKKQLYCIVSRWCKPKVWTTTLFFQYKASCPGTGSCMFNCTCLTFNDAMIQEFSSDMISTEGQITHVICNSCCPSLRQCRLELINAK